MIWLDEPSRHAAASGSVDGPVSITRAAGAYLAKLRTRNDVELLRSPYDARKFMIGRSAIFLMLTSPTPIEGKPAAAIALPSGPMRGLSFDVFGGCRPRAGRAGGKDSSQQVFSIH
jgi:hypothetical protein